MSEDKVKDTAAETQSPSEEAEVAAEEAQAAEDAETSEEAQQAAEDAGAEEKKDDGDERYMRLMAEFQNYKKRVTKEKSDIREFATEKLITELLPVLDNFERALASDAESDPAAYAKGMEMIFTQMKTALEKDGLKEVEALGEEFDPKCHNAVMNEDTEEFESGKVSKVLMKGYALNDKVIRPAMVAVAQ